MDRNQSNKQGSGIKFEDGNSESYDAYYDMEEELERSEVSEEVAGIWRKMASFGTGEELDRYAEAFVKEPIGLTDRPMYRFAVFHLEDGDRSGILVVISHLISDSWTFGLMAEQIDVAYRKLAGETDISPVEGDYADFIKSEEQYFASERYGKDESYWEEKYTARPEATPVKLCQTPVNSVEARRVIRTLPTDLEQNISTYCKNRPVTQAVLFGIALILYLSRINPENQAVTVGVPVLNRSGAKEKAVAGMFVSTMPLTVSVAEEKLFNETSLYVGQPLNNVYIHSKFEAERAVLDAMLMGLDAKIIRVGNLTSRAADYKFQPNYRENAFLTRFKAILEFGLFPDYLMPLYCEFSP